MGGRGKIVYIIWGPPLLCLIYFPRSQAKSNLGIARLRKTQWIIFLLHPRRLKRTQNIARLTVAQMAMDNQMSLFPTILKGG